jgi:hypothetical protein
MPMYALVPSRGDGQPGPKLAAATDCETRNDLPAGGFTRPGGRML